MREEGKKVKGRRKKSKCAPEAHAPSAQKMADKSAQNIGVMEYWNLGMVGWWKARG
jgi:hypothetical protein